MHPHPALVVTASLIQQAVVSQPCHNTVHPRLEPSPQGAGEAVCSHHRTEKPARAKIRHSETVNTVSGRNILARRAHIQQILHRSLPAHARQSWQPSGPRRIGEHPQQLVASRQRPGTAIRDNNIGRIVALRAVETVAPLRLQRILHDQRNIARRNGFKRSRRDHGARTPHRRKVPGNLRLQRRRHGCQFICANPIGQCGQRNV